MKKYINKNSIIIIVYIIFIIITYMYSFTAGEKIRTNFFNFSKELLLVLPVVFILIGLFEVWVKRETIEKHLGENSNWQAYLWVIILAMPIIGGIYAALPIALALYKKGAKLSVVITFLNATGSFRIPMTLFEASFLGIKFTIIRLLISLPVVIISSILLEKIVIKKTGYSQLS